MSMMVLVIGGSGSGKSDYAEKFVDTISNSENNMKSTDGKMDGQSVMKKYYLAAMQVLDEEGRRKVERHRRLRRGKGFVTIEQPVEIHKALEQMESGERIVLLECISNLTANEMFSKNRSRSEIQVTERIVRGIELLKDQVAHLVVVSNNVFEDGIVYDETTMEYIRAMGRINQRLAALADRVVEVVVGIPVTI